MDNNHAKLRRQIIELLQNGQAHVGFDRAVAKVPMAARGKRPKGAAHSLWEVLEHMRIAQFDIVAFTRNPKWESPKWPEGYWPKSTKPPNAKAWNQCIAAIRKDRDAMLAMVADEEADILAPLPHDPTKSVLREALLLADHNAYHLAEVVHLRRLLGNWK